MIRTAVLTDRRGLSLAAALLSLPLALGCEGRKRETPRLAQVPNPPTSTPVIPVSGPGVGLGVAPVTPASVRYAQAESLYRSGNYSAAKAGFEQFVEREPENVLGHYMLGLSAWKSGDLTGAERAFEGALARDSVHRGSLLNSARVLLELGRPQEALDRVRTAQGVDSTSESLRVLARAQDELGDPEAAIKSLQEALVRNERDAWAMNNLGMLYIRQRNFPAALPPLARAVQLRPGAPVFQNNLGIALELNGHVAQAREAYEGALRADSTYAKAIANAKRVSDVVSDSTSSADVNLRELAEEFRRQSGGGREAGSSGSEVGKGGMGSQRICAGSPIPCRSLRSTGGGRGS